MEYDKVVQERRSIRKFKKEFVEEEKIEKIIECARLCQSAKNRQPWKFMILENEEKDQIANIMLDLFEQNDVEMPGYMNSSRYSANIILQAPILILIFREKDDHWLFPDILSIGAAMEHICLEAVNLQLGALWIGDVMYTEEEIRKSTRHEELQLVSGIAIGYPDENPNPRPRNEMSEIIVQ